MGQSHLHELLVGQLEQAGQGDQPTTHVIGGRPLALVHQVVLQRGPGMLEDRADLQLDRTVGNTPLGEPERGAVLVAEPHQEVQALVARHVEHGVGSLVGHLLHDEEALNETGDRGHVGAQRDEDPGADEVGQLVGRVGVLETTASVGLGRLLHEAVERLGPGLQPGVLEAG